jgi:hypothetical protein
VPQHAQHTLQLHVAQHALVYTATARIVKSFFLLPATTLTACTNSHAHLRCSLQQLLFAGP